MNIRQLNAKKVWQKFERKNEEDKKCITNNLSYEIQKEHFHILLQYLNKSRNCWYYVNSK